MSKQLELQPRSVVSSPFSRTDKSFRYSAFISYKREPDAKLAEALQAALHRFSRPWYKPWVTRIYRDKTDLQMTADLWREIEAGLSQSEHLILLASPEAATSPWITKELEYWLTHRSVETLLIVPTDGNLVWSKSERDFD